jgi:hypothetical protein
MFLMPRASRKAAGFRLSKEKQSLKIDGCVALSFACVAAGQNGRPASGKNYESTSRPKWKRLSTPAYFELRNFDERRVDVAPERFDPFNP